MKLKIVLSIIFLMMMGTLSAFAIKNILMINSYNEGFKWTDEIVKGVTEKLYGAEIENELEYQLFIEYLDSKRLYSEGFYDVFLVLLSKKYESIAFDLIMVSDNDSLEFLNLNYDRLFSGIPVVFCGVNGYEDSMISNIREETTGIPQNSSIYDTVYWAIKQNPDAESFYVYLDTLSDTGKNMKKDFLEQVSGIKGIDMILRENRTLEEVSEEIKNVPESSFVFLLTWFAESNHILTFPERAASTLMNNSKAPIYALSKPFIGNGIAGGKMTDPYILGRKMAEISLDILSGVNPSDIPITDYELNEFIYDYEILNKYGISADSIPENSLIINSPVNIFEEYSTAFIIFAILFLALFSIITILSYNNFKMKKVYGELKAKNKNLEELNEELMAYEEELSASNEELNRQYVELEKNKEKIEETGKVLLKTNRELIINKNRFNSLFMRTPLAMMIWDSQKRILEWNDSAQRIFHWTAEEVKGKNFLDFMVPESSMNSVTEKIENIKKSEKLELVNENFTKEGEIIICEWKTAVVNDEEGNIIETISLGQDITQKYKSEIVLRKRYDTEKLISHLSSVFMRNVNFEETMRDSLEKVAGFCNSEIGIFIYFDKDETEKHFYPDSGKFGDKLNVFKVQWFDSLFRFLDYHIIPDVQDSRIISAEFKDFLSSLGIESLITLLVDVGKDSKGLLMFARRDYDISIEKEDITILKIFSDILTRILERRNFEEMLIQEREKAVFAKMEKDEIITSIGHRIRTPMNGIIGLNKILSQTKLNEEQKEISDMISDSSRKLMEVIEELFGVGKKEEKNTEGNS